MSSDVNPRRKYVSKRREDQAAATRAAVLDAAMRLFSEGGWSSTTIAAIAREADVSKETIYALWGTKAAIAAELVQRAIRGVQPQVPLLEQEGLRRMAGTKSAPAKLRVFAADVAGVLSRVAPLVDVIRTAASSDAESAELYAKLHAGRRRNLATVAEALSPNLRKGVSLADATEHIWRQASPELFLLLTRQAGYDLSRYADWLAAALERLLL
jgi:AcrR family transcriptional regulator